MAKLIPSGVVQLPNFAELQFKLNENERQKQLQFDEWSSQFDKKAGTYLDGDKEAVQEAYSSVEAALKELARDPDNVDLRRKVREANANYNQVAGSAQFLADNYRQQWSAWNTDPDKFDLGGKSAVEVFDAERTTKRDANQIMSMASNPFTLSAKYKYDMQSPTQIADEALETVYKNINDYIRADGSIDQNKAKEFITNFMEARYIDPNQVRNAVVYEGVRQNIIGRNGQITSRADLDIIDTEAFKPQSEKLAGKFREDAINAFMVKVPKMGVSRYQMAKDAEERAARIDTKRFQSMMKSPYFQVQPQEMQLAGRGASGNITKGFDKGLVYNVGFAPIKTGTEEVVGYGKFGGKDYYIRTTERLGPDGTKQKVTQVKPMTRDVMSNIRSKVGADVFDMQMDIIGGYQQEEQQQTNAAASGSFDVKGAESALLPQETQGPSDGGVWSADMFSESRFAAPQQQAEVNIPSVSQFFENIKRANEEKLASINVPVIPGVKIIDQQ